MFTTTASATTSTSTTPVTTAANTVQIGREKGDWIEIEIDNGTGRDDNNDGVADSRAGSSNYSLSSASSSGNSYYQPSSTAPRSGHLDTATATTASPSSSSSSPTPAQRSKPHRRGLAPAKAASATGDRGHQVTRPSPLRSMMSAT